MHVAGVVPGALVGMPLEVPEAEMEDAVRDRVRPFVAAAPDAGIAVDLAVGIDGCPFAGGTRVSSAGITVIHTRGGEPVVAIARIPSSRSP